MASVLPRKAINRPLLVHQALMLYIRPQEHVCSLEASATASALDMSALHPIYSSSFAKENPCGTKFHYERCIVKKKASVVGLTDVVAFSVAADAEPHPPKDSNGNYLRFYRHVTPSRTRVLRPPRLTCISSKTLEPVRDSRAFSTKPRCSNQTR
ncbi:hypothetical protein Fmac_028076 [Flemingia macrophylla]|uniref:Uncharacterized protein n=1 Tax=Flemingia macrophylla TaxID=520843 RepID=A0ABD1LJJ3_9FABA